MNPPPSEVLCLYCLDPRLHTRTKWGSLKCFKYRAKFLLESIADLRINLRALGSDLLVADGFPEDILPKLVDEDSRNVVILQEDYTHEESEIITNIKYSLSREPLCEIMMISDSSLLHFDDLPFKNNFHDLPVSFTQFRKYLDRYNYTVRSVFPTIALNQLLIIKETSSKRFISDSCSFDYLPTIDKLYPDDTEGITILNTDPRTVFPFSGGETAALLRVQQWIFEDRHIDSYFETRNGLLGVDYSSKFSPWLAIGCLSPRYNTQYPLNEMYFNLY